MALLFLREVEARQLETSSQSRNRAQESSQLTSKSLMSSTHGAGDSFDFVHHSRRDDVKINRDRVIKDIENLGKGLTECFGHFAFFGNELGSRFEFGSEIGGGLEKRDGRLSAIKNLAVLICRKTKT